MADSFSTPPLARIFISYKRTTKPDEPDEPVALRIADELAALGQVFIDQKGIKLGQEWRKRIVAALRESNFFIVLLSARSVLSEMVLAEIKLADQLNRSSNGRPAILPVKLAYGEQLPYPLDAYLERFQFASWESNDDTDGLVAELKEAIGGGDLLSRNIESVSTTEPSAIPAPTPAAQPQRLKQLDPTKLDSPEGTIDPQSAFYVERTSDATALNAIQRQGATITIKGPRQMGKSSLLIRTLAAAVKAGKRPVFLDYQLIERETLTQADRFYRRFCDWVTDELEMENRVDEYWNSPLGNSQRCTRYFSRYLLKELQQPLVLAMDEVENLFDTSFRSDFFSMLRSWHNSRANIATPIWKQLDLVLVTSTEPYQLIENLNQSPFNVGEVINLEDFTPAQVADLNQRHGAPLNHEEERRLVSLLCGQPYLTRRALYLIATGRLSVAELFATAADERGPFGDHLRYHLFRIHNKEELVRGLCDALLRHTCDDEHLFFRLRGAGLVQPKRKGHTVELRCQLYVDFFREHLKCQPK